MRGTSLLLLCLLWSLVVVHSQSEYPYVSFMGETLPNHAYVNLSRVGEDGSGRDSVQCHTNLSTCCNKNEGDHRGDWFLPDREQKLPFLADLVRADIYEVRRDQRVDIRRRNYADVSSGIYRCDIATYNDSNITDRESVYVGLYASGGDVTASNITLSVDSDLNGASPQFTLTCISIGGPATTVTWTRDSDTVTEGTETVLDDRVTAQYTHTLTVTGRLGGLYTFNVANDKPSEDSVNFTLNVASAPTNMTAVQEGLTSIRVSWSPPTPLGDTTGYKIYYNNSDSNDSVDVSGGSTENYTLTGLQNGDSYNISILATSEHFFSDISQEISLGLIPSQPNITVASVTNTSIFISWSVPSGLVVDSYEVTWISHECPHDIDQGNETISGASYRYTIEGLRGGTSYNITVSATNSADTVYSDTVTGETKERVPSAAPTSVKVSAVTFINFTVRWGGVKCAHRNGDITGYTVVIKEELGLMRMLRQDTSSNVYEETFTERKVSTNYSIRVAAINSAGVGVYSDAIYVKTKDALLLAVNSTSTSVSITWILDPRMTPTSYTISYSNTNTDCFNDSNILTDVVTNKSMYTLTGLQEDTEYSITVTARDKILQSVENSILATTMTAAPSGAPTSVSVSEVTSYSIIVQWGAVDCIHRNGDIKGYSVRYGVVGTESTQTESIPEGSSDKIITDLISSTNYSIEVAAENNEGIGNYSGIYIETGDSISVVTNSTSTSSLTISWTLDDALTATSYTISYSNTNTDCFTQSDDITGIATSTTMYTLTDLQEGTKYSITVTALLSDGETAEDSLTATTMTAAPSAAPTSVSVSQVASTNITVQWEVVDCISRNGNITGYSVRYGRVERDRTVVVVSGSNVTEATITNMMPTSIEVAAMNSVGVGVYSEPVMVTTHDSVYLILTGTIIASHGYVEISDIGSTNDTALICHTDHPATVGNTSSGGNWFSPDGTKVTGDVVPGFMSTRDPMIVRLLRNTATDPPSEGMYICVIKNDTVYQTVYVELYNNKIGISEMFEAVAGQRQVNFSWSPPPVTQYNGALISYTLSCSPSPSSLLQSPSQSGPLTVAGFAPNTSYTCSLVASNKYGSGPAANVSFTTLEDYSFFQLRLAIGGVNACSEFTVSLRYQKLENITNAVLEELTDSCSDCGITNDIIDNQQFSCFPESPTYVTYRARLEGTSETDSGSLISLIEEWVSGGASIIVAGVLMTVDSECSVAISSLSEGECLTSDNTDMTITIAIAATIAGIVVMIISVAIVAVVMYVTVKHCRRDRAIKKGNDYVMVDLPASADAADDSGITTTNNVAYKVVTLRGRGGSGRGEGEGGRHEGGISGGRGGGGGEERGGGVGEGAWDGVPASCHHYELVNLLRGSPTAKPLDDREYAVPNPLALDDKEYTVPNPLALDDKEYTVPTPLAAPYMVVNVDRAGEGEGNGYELIPGLV